MATIRGDIDTTYLTQQRDAFASGLVAKVGPNAYSVWMAIKSHADWNTGEAWCGVRRIAEMAGMSPMTAQRAIKALLSEHLLRVVRKDGQKVIYIARERMDVRLGAIKVATIAIDYVPNSMRERLAEMKERASRGELIDLGSDDVHAYYSIIPNPDAKHDPASGHYVGRIRADDVPVHEDLDSSRLPQNAATVLIGSTEKR
ncbi:hypothetical protein [uncultured Azohydromonas sp.]|jgi:DNA-binding transcriptional regulator YhcF (GntR family)|uniref:hypothetical protein n=1 Tax=uncultured Azohydromonas sp. TaxID=487342 RepID=UPI002615A43A|nr:hypothetical protein [uncultured Azohydromonas sp.]